MSVGQLAVYSRGGFTEEAIQGKVSEDSVWGQLAVYSRGGFSEEGRQRRRKEEEERRERRTGEHLEI